MGASIRWILGAVAVATAASLSSMSGCAADVVGGAGGSGGGSCSAPGQTRTCYSAPPSTLGIGVCKPGTQTCGNDGLWGTCEGEVVPSAEKCDGLDNDCNGLTDENCPCEPTMMQDCYGALPVTEGVGICRHGQQLCQHHKWSDICFNQITPQTEQCDGIDNDCNGQIDDGIDCKCSPDGETRACYSHDPVTEGVGVCHAGQQVCESGKWGPCLGEVVPTPETCDGIDNNCDGTVDNGSCPSGHACQNHQCVKTCPFVYAFDGSGFAFETTVGGASLIGGPADLANGRAMDFSPMWARLDHAHIAWRGGEGSIKTKLLIAEEEIAYVDEAHLTAVIHPEGFEVVSSSSMEWPTLHRDDPQVFYAFRSKALRGPDEALWQGKVDVTREMGSLDERAVAADPKQDNFYDLDFGPVGANGHASLVIDGWKYKIARDLPSSIDKRPPRLEVRQPDGSYKGVMRLAQPRGDRKSVAFDLASITWPEGRYAMRLYTGTNEEGLAMWYVDRARLTEEPPADVHAVDVAPRSAELSFFGAPSIPNADDFTHPRFNTDDGRGALGLEQRTFGRFTRYGDVRDLLGAADDRLVVMRQGDGIELAFEGIPQAKKGEALTLFLRTELLFKPRVCIGCDAATTASSKVEPLPFHGMTHYPYGADETYPADAEHRASIEQYDTREYTALDTAWGK